MNTDEGNRELHHLGLRGEDESDPRGGDEVEGRDNAHDQHGHLGGFQTAALRFLGILRP